MAAYDLPDAFLPAAARIWLDEAALVVESPLTGDSVSRPMPGSKWRMTIDYPPMKSAKAAAREAFWNRVGRSNTVRVWHPRRPVPRGTMRGSPKLNAAAAKGATTLVILTTAGATLLSGDCIGIGDQLVQIPDDAMADGSGVLTVTIQSKLRIGYAVNTPIVWDRPRVEMRVLSPIEHPYVPGQALGITVDLREK